MNKNLGSASARPKYVAPRTTTYDEAKVAEELGPVMLSGTGTQLNELSGNTTDHTIGNTSKPRR